MHISKYDNGNLFNHDETRSRELLLHEHEITKLATKVKLEGLAIVALKAYFVDALLKIEIGLCRGKKLADKREAIKELFAVKHATISEHINNIFKEGELDEKTSVGISDKSTGGRKSKIYNLDVVISVGYELNRLKV